MLIRRERQYFLLEIIALFIIVFGLYLRTRQYFVGRSLWLDEAFLALNIVNRSFAGLTQQLDYNQGAPVGFLFLQKAVIQALGNNDYILRLFPFIAGIAAMILMYNVTRNYIGSRGMPIALGLFAISAPLVYYASEAKQYSSDVMISLLLLLIAYKCIDTNATLKHFFVLGFVGALSLWVSHPALFVLVGIGFSLALDVFLRKDKSKYLWLSGVFFFWSVNFIILYFISLRFLGANEGLLNYWSHSFMPVPPWHNMGWFYTTFLAMLESPVGLTNTLLGAILFLLGCLSLFSRNWRLALILTMPFLITLIVSGFGKYPFEGRLLLFIVPMVILFITEGVERSYQVLRKYNFVMAIGLWIVLVGLLFYQPVKAAVFWNLSNPTMEEHIKPVMVYLGQNKQDTESIYVYYGARPAFEYYAPLYGFENSDYIIGISSRAQPEKYIQDIDTLNRQGRIWFVFSHNCSWCKVNEEVYFLEHLDELGTKIDKFESLGASVYLYDLSLPEP
jgi:hypothetical protein